MKHARVSRDKHGADVDAADCRLDVARPFSASFVASCRRHGRPFGHGGDHMAAVAVLENAIDSDVDLSAFFTHW